MPASAEPRATAILLPVPEAEPVVGAWRDRYDLAETTGVPAHITILFPFIPPELITGEDEAGLAKVAADVAPFAFELAGTGRFGDAVLYLAPEPAEAFVALTEAVVARFPEHPPYGWAHAEIVPHLTIVRARLPLGG